MSIEGQLGPFVDAVNVPDANSKVQKDECTFSFAGPLCPEGLYICLQTFFALSPRCLHLHHSRTGSRLYAHLTQRKEEREAEAPTEAPKEMAIGTEGGFDVGDSKLVDEYELYIYDAEKSSADEWVGDTIPADKADQFPERIRNSFLGVMLAESAAKQSAVASWRASDHILVSPYAESLEQLPTLGKKVPLDPAQWKCDVSGSTVNLWLNLTDGSILSGRVEMGGSGDALKHYEKMKYPLAVKLATISPEGAEVWSYPEDDLVQDPKLKEHLRHWGIDMDKMTKHERTLLEMEVDRNFKHDWSALEQASATFQPIYGPGYTGISNLGNSCYVNSLVQALFQLPQFKARYVDQREAIFGDKERNPTEDFDTQFAKLGHGLVSGQYSQKPAEGETAQCIKPRLFRTVAGADHPEFKTSKQQDVEEYFQHILTHMQKSDAKSKNPIQAGASFSYSSGERLYCEITNKVSYKKTEEASLPIYIDVPAKELAEGEEPPVVTLESCLEKYKEPAVTEWKHPDFGEQAQVKKTTGMLTFPDNLMVVARRYTLSESYEQVKLPAKIVAPEDLDISSLRATGPQPGEALFDAVEESNEGVAQIAAMGFPEPVAKAALKASGNDVNRATEYIFAHMDELDQLAAQAVGDEEKKEGGEEQREGPPLTDGAGQYKLKAVISHMGKTTGSGHYVAHCRVNGKWVLYNDEKVGETTDLPWNIAYLFLYSRA